MSNLFNNGSLVHVSRKSGWTACTSKLKDSDMQTKNPEIIKGRKMLIDQEKIQELILKPLAKARAIYGKMGYDFMGLQSTWFVPKDLLPIADAKFEEAKKEAYASIEQFLIEYPQLKAEWKEKAPDMYDESIYPSVEDLRASYGISKSEFKMEAQVNGLSTEEAAVKKAELNRDLDDFLAVVMKTIHTELYAVITELNKAARLGKGFNQRRLGTIKTYLEMYRAMNITGVEELNSFAEKLRSLIGDSDKNDWKDNDFNKQIAKETRKLATELKEDSKIKRSIML